MATVVVMWEMSTFGCGDLFDALDARRDEDGLGWYELADELWEQSAGLNVERPDDHPLCRGRVHPPCPVVKRPASLTS